MMKIQSRQYEVIYPPIPAFYNNPENLGDIIDHSAGRALDHLDIEVANLKRWEGR